MSDEIKKIVPQELSSANITIDVLNGGVPADFYSANPCLIGYAYIRFEVDGNILPCCIAKHSIGSVYEQDWRDVWHSGPYENFRKKMSRIHIEKFHLRDPEWTFCQQCSHMTKNSQLNKLLQDK